MKKLLLVIAFLFSFEFANSQNCLGLTKSETINKIIKEKGENYYEPPVMDYTEDGYQYLLFTKKDDLLISTAYYFNERGICILYKMILPYSELNSCMKFFNENMVKTNEDEWVDYSKNYDYKWTLERRENLFFMACIIIKVH